MSKTYFRQCTLQKPLSDATTTRVAWIPEKFAVQGKYVKLKEQDRWEDGWQVISVGRQRRTKEDVQARSLDYKKQREGSDI